MDTINTTEADQLEQSLGSEELVPRCTLLTLDPVVGLLGFLTGGGAVECAQRARYRVLFDCTVPEHPHPHVELACDPHYERVKADQPAGPILWIRFEEL